MKDRPDRKPLRTEAELRIGKEIESIFAASQDSIEIRLENFPKYVRRSNITRFLALYEIFKQVLGLKGSVVECGVNRGFRLMTWAKLSAVLEPNNLTRRIYGFDTFAGFPSVHELDRAPGGESPIAGGLASDSYDELVRLLALYDDDRFLGHVPKVELIKGDATESIPAFLESHPHLVVSLLFMDFDLFEPTRAALEAFVPRMPRVPSSPSTSWTTPSGRARRWP